MDFKGNILSLFFLGFSMLLSAQGLESRFGIKGGLNLTFFEVNQQSLGSYSTSETGFYGGIFAEFPIDNLLRIQPEVLYISVGDFNILNMPIYVKYEVVSKLHLFAGPSVNYFFDFMSNKLKIGADISSSYDITNDLDAHIKFALGFDELAPNGLFFGLGLKL